MGSIKVSEPVQMHIWVQKKPEMTRAEFHDYWVNNHGVVFTSFAVVKKHCLKYEQYLDDPDERAAVEAGFGLPVTGWDGLAILTFDSFEGAKAVYADPAFAKWATEDEGKFCAYPDVTQRIAVIGKPRIAFEQ